MTTELTLAQRIAAQIQYLGIGELRALEDLMQSRRIRLQDEVTNTLKQAA